MLALSITAHVHSSSNELIVSVASGLGHLALIFATIELLQLRRKLDFGALPATLTYFVTSAVVLTGVISNIDTLLYQWILRNSTGRLDAVGADLILGTSAGVLLLVPLAIDATERIRRALRHEQRAGTSKWRGIPDPVELVLVAIVFLASLTPTIAIMFDRAPLSLTLLWALVPVVLIIGYALRPVILAATVFVAIVSFLGATHLKVTALPENFGLFFFILCLATLITSTANKERQRFASQLRQSIFHDVLTGTLNKSGLIAKLDDYDPNRTLSVFMITLKDFAALNDELGRTFGDLALKRVATRIRRCLRPHDAVGRISGDQFAALIFTNEIEFAPENLAARIADAIKQPIVNHGQSTNLGCHIGIVDGTSKDDLLGRADAAARHAKAQKDELVFYDHELHARVERDRKIEIGLNSAAHLGQLKIVYQPVVDFSDNSAFGAEALLRWEHPSLGPIYPDEFIPIAERCGAIVPITEWVVTHVIQTVAAWRRNVAREFRVAANVSAQSLTSPQFCEMVKSALTRFDCPPNLIGIEVHEDLLANEIGAVSHVLVELADLGMPISIDDFGTGNVSLAHLQRLPLSSLKIDRTFMADIPFSRRNVQLVSSIVRIADSLELDVVAEGIESAAQATFVAELGCRYGQGYLYGQPCSALEFIKRVDEFEAGRSTRIGT